jgi:rfaE bifunctional protein nucleotidyltransferase chain/domain
MSSSSKKYREKIITRDEVQALALRYRDGGKKVGFTSGTFDLIHPGHVTYLAEAKEKVDILIVGVNSDDSVKSYKDPTRPIVPERARLEVIAALSSVDHVFVFSETNNNRNIELLKPDYYIKAGDYTSSTLSSTPIVESYGGKVEIIPFEAGFSTTAILKKIELQSKSVEGQDIRYEKRPAVFVDRDGTIIEHVEYLSESKKVKEIPGSFAALKRLKEHGYRIVIITNQPGIGLGYFTREDLFEVNREMLTQATKAGLAIDRIYFCPHSKADGCTCRKPGTYLLKRAEKELNVDISRSYMIGDMTSDVMTGKNAGCAGVLVKTGRGGDDGICEVAPDMTVDSLAQAADLIIANGKILSEPSRGIFVQPSDDAVVEALGRFGGDVGHDYNNILGSILACVDLIRQRSAGTDAADEIEDILTILEKATNTGISLSNRIRGLARPGEIKKTSVSLLGCVTSVVELLKQTRKQPCNFEIICPEDVTVEVADFTVSQTILQLCENSLDAMKHLPERFIVFGISKERVDDTVSELSRGLYVILSISDHGKGITTSRQEEVFQPFSSHKGRTIGKGLGLSMASASTVMKQHGGALVLASTPSVGTTIRLYFPVSAN